MIVTAIKQQKNDTSRYSVFIDDTFAFGLIKDDIAYFKLKEGCEINAEKYNFITDNLVYIKAQSAALNYISYKSRTKKEVLRKLTELEYGETMIEKVLCFLEKYNYVNDKSYSESYIRESVRLRPRSAFLLKMELAQRGVDANIIDQALLENELDEKQGALRLLKKKVKDFSHMDEKERRKAFAFLQRKGYSYEVIKEAFQICEREQE